MTKEQQQTPKVTEGVELTDEQRDWVREHLDINPDTLSLEQKRHITEHWERSIYTECIRECMEAKNLKGQPKEQIKEALRECAERATEEVAKQDDEFHRLFPPREMTSEEEEQDILLAEAVRKAGEKRDELFTSIMDIAEPNWLVEAVAVREGITLLFGDAGVGKTSLMLQLIDCARTGQDFLSLKVKGTTPLLIEQDENPSMLRGHVERMLPTCPSLKWLVVPTEQVLWNNTRSCFADNTLDELIQYSGLADLIIIDSLTSLGIEDINLPSCSLVFDRLRDVARRWRCAIVLIHHPNKSGEVMGSNLMRAKTDVMAHLKKDRLVFEKLRGTTPSSLTIDLSIESHPYLPMSQDADSLVFRMDRATAIQSMVLEGKERADIVTAIARDYGGTRDTVGKAVDREKRKLRDAGRLPSS